MVGVPKSLSLFKHPSPVTKWLHFEMTPVISTGGGHFPEPDPVLGYTVGYFKVHLFPWGGPEMGCLPMSTPSQGHPHEEIHVPSNFLS